MGLYKPKRVMEVPEDSLAFGICVWQFPDGSYLQDEYGNHFCAQSGVGNPITESKMRNAVKEMGITEGNILWLPGFRKITNSEWEDQMERLLDGKIPDSVDIYRQANGQG